MITSVRFCLSHSLLNAILSPSKFVYLNEKLHYCNGRRHDVTCSRRKCYVTCGHNMIYDIEDIYFFEVNTKYISSSAVKKSVFFTSA